MKCCYTQNTTPMYKNKISMQKNYSIVIDKLPFLPPVWDINRVNLKIFATLNTSKKSYITIKKFSWLV